MSRNRKRIINDRDFHKLWSLVSTVNNKEEYINKVFRGDEKLVNIQEKYGLQYDEVAIMLSYIYIQANKPFAEICHEIGRSKAQMSHLFCIPIRTIEEWYSGKNKMPGYIKLMIYRYFHILNLGKNIYIEGDEIHRQSLPRRYSKRNSGTLIPLENDTSEGYSSDTEITYDNYERAVSSGNYNDIAESIKIRELLNKTDYLTDIIGRKN